MVRKGFLQGSSHSLWTCGGKSQECRTSATERDAAGTGRIARRDGRGHAWYQGSTVRLAEAVVHGRGQEVIVLTVEGVHQQGNAATVKDGVGPVHLGWQDSTGLRGGELEVRDGHDEGEFRREWEPEIAVVSPVGIRQGQA